MPSIDWLIIGGESGPQARPCDVAWIRGAMQQAKAAGVPCFVKQLGAQPTLRFTESPWPAGDWAFTPDDSGEFIRVRLKNSKGGDPSEWPADLCVQEWPA